MQTVGTAAGGTFASGYTGVRTGGLHSRSGTAVHDPESPGTRYHYKGDDSKNKGPPVAKGRQGKALILGGVGAAIMLVMLGFFWGGVFEPLRHEIVAQSRPGRGAEGTLSQVLSRPVKASAQSVATPPVPSPPVGKATVRIEPVLPPKPPKRMVKSKPPVPSKTNAPVTVDATSTLPPEPEASEHAEMPQLPKLPGAGVTAAKRGENVPAPAPAERKRIISPEVISEPKHNGNGKASEPSQDQRETPKAIPAQQEIQAERPSSTAELARDRMQQEKPASTTVEPPKNQMPLHSEPPVKLSTQEHGPAKQRLAELAARVRHTAETDELPKQISGKEALARLASGRHPESGLHQREHPPYQIREHLRKMASMHHAGKTNTLEKIVNSRRLGDPVRVPRAMPERRHLMATSLPGRVDPARRRTQVSYEQARNPEIVASQRKHWEEHASAAPSVDMGAAKTVKDRLAQLSASRHMRRRQ